MTGARELTMRTGVSRLELIAPGARYESALAFAVPDEVARVIEALRSGVRFDAPPEHQLEPHVTVLFLGRMEGSRLIELHAALGALLPATARVRTDGVGTFGAGGMVENLHVRLVDERGELAALHRRAVEACRSIGWQPQTDRVLDRFEPHISIVDRVRVPERKAIAAFGTVPPRAFTLDDLHMLAKRL